MLPAPPAFHRNTTTAISFTTNVDWSLSISDAGDMLKRLFVVQMGADEDENFASYFSPEFAQWLVGKDYLGNAERITSADIAMITEIKTDRENPPVPQGVELLYNLEEFVYENYIFGHNDKSVDSLDLSQNTKLKTLLFMSWDLKYLNLKGCHELTSLTCSANKLTSLDLSDCPNIETLNCSGNLELTTLDISNCPNIKSLIVGNTGLTEVDLTNCRQLNEIDVSRNKFTEFDLSGFKHLTTVSCFDSPTLSSLNLSNCPNLTTVYVESNDVLASLDLSNCENLDYVQCPGNQLTTLKLAADFQAVE